ncbi:MAG: hypothetical protein J7619_28675 [Dyadobacter sp.]|uniref:DUF3592 domain-containing protein n=1 Tax=Dyadobacter sp. TaxID=1914288 RepID=UPI001B1AB1EF|nr:DUF3592 domain-containing protein [Dyadobacter sp.]MBO9616696.1 hypothetical protein [Dyadobacter sp.]
MKRKGSSFDLVDAAKTVFSVAIVGTVLYLFVRRFADSYNTTVGTESRGVDIQAVIVDERNYMGNGTRAFSYSYEFVVNGERFRGDSRASRYDVGDSLWVVYDPLAPKYNRPKDNQN